MQFIKKKPSCEGFWWAKLPNGKIVVKKVYKKHNELWAGSIKIESSLYENYLWAGPIEVPNE